jgi:hypothetical protein
MRNFYCSRQALLFDGFAPHGGKQLADEADCGQTLPAASVQELHGGYFGWVGETADG